MSYPTTPLLHIAGEWDVLAPRVGWKAQLKHAVKQVVFACYLYSGWIQLRDAICSWLGVSRIVILYYHRVGWIDRLTKPTGEFRAELEYLVRHYECLTLRQLIERFQTETPITRKIAVITFDDGYRDNYLSAFPELKRLSIPATFFVSTGYVGTRQRFPHDIRALARGQAARDDWDKLSWAELREMQDSGMEIGSHTVGHRNLQLASDQELVHEVRDSLRHLQLELGGGPRAFCFPWGTPDSFNERAIREIRQAGYYAAATTIPGPAGRSSDLFRLRRIDVGNGHFSRLGVLATIEGLGWGWLARGLRFCLGKGQ